MHMKHREGYKISHMALKAMFRLVEFIVSVMKMSLSFCVGKAMLQNVFREKEGCLPTCGL